MGNFASKFPHKINDNKISKYVEILNQQIKYVSNGRISFPHMWKSRAGCYIKTTASPEFLFL